MRLIFNKDEVPAVTHRMQQALNEGDGSVEIILIIPRLDAESFTKKCENWDGEASLTWPQAPSFKSRRT